MRKLAHDCLKLANSVLAKKTTRATINAILRKMKVDPEEYESNRDSVTFWGKGEPLEASRRAEKLMEEFMRILKRAGIVSEAKSGAGDQWIVHWRNVPEDKGDWNDPSSKWHY
jgi:hypothetical protein